MTGVRAGDRVAVDAAYVRPRGAAGVVVGAGPGAPDTPGLVAVRFDRPGVELVAPDGTGAALPVGGTAWVREEDCRGAAPVGGHPAERGPGAPGARGRRRRRRG